MNLNLSDLLTPAEVEFFSTQHEEAQLRLNSAEAEQVAAIRAHFADERLQLTRRVLLAVLSVSAPLPSQPSAIMVTPTSALEVPVQEDDSPCPSCGISREWCLSESEDGRITNPGYYYDCENPTCPLLEDANIPASGEAAPVLNILTDDKMLSAPPPTPANKYYTAHELAAELGCHKDSIHNYRKAGLIGEPAPGTGGHPHNPNRFYVPSIPALRKAIQERQEAAKRVMVKPKTVVAAPTAPAFDTNEEGKYQAIEQGKHTFLSAALFNLIRRTTDTGRLWDVLAAGLTPPLGWDIFEEWRRTGLGKWESTPAEPGVAGTGNGVTLGMRNYKVAVLG